jgi:asparagine synthase (glutamine-hydrolysing)
MCGICGIVGDVDPQCIEGMVSAMRHRGPDDSGIFQEKGIGLGMARLAIIDITLKGHQPMSNAAGSVWIVYNGETYNFLEERDILRKKGHSFNSTSDTEVVLRMYEQYGDDFLQRLRGMFALAIYDKRAGAGKQRLLLARDHLGIKPLLYSRVGSIFIFSSEMKSMLATGLIDKRFDPESLRLLLTYGSIAQPMTAVSGIRMLLPGHRMIIQSGTERIERFWQLGIDRISNLHQKPYEELVHIVKTSLEESVRLQMVSDVPVGAFLSGGVDSSILVAMMSQITGTPVKTFSVGFEQEGRSIDETDDAQRVARFIGTDHKRVLVTGQDVRDRITHIAAALDQPSVDGVNSYFVSLAAKQAVTVAISGTGGDELFAGYPWFMSMVASVHHDRRNRWISAGKQILSGVARSEIFDPLSTGRWGRLLERARVASGFLSRYARQYQIFGVNGVSRILAREVKKLSRIGREPSHDIALADELSFGSPLTRISALCLRGYTQNQLLRDIDAVSMSHSLEVRVPFLDPIVTDVALSLPDSAKLGDISSVSNPGKATYRETGTKKILIDTGRDLIPHGMDLQQKRGFCMPFDSWLKGKLLDVLDDTLSARSVNKRGYFNAQEVECEKARFLRGKSSWVYPWLLMITELWCREVLDIKSRRQFNSLTAKDGSA